MDVNVTLLQALYIKARNSTVGTLKEFSKEISIVSRNIWKDRVELRQTSVNIYFCLRW